MRSFDPVNKASSMDHIPKHPVKPIVQILFGCLFDLFAVNEFYSAYVPYYRPMMNSRGLVFLPQTE